MSRSIAVLCLALLWGPASGCTDRAAGVASPDAGVLDLGPDAAVHSRSDLAGIPCGTTVCAALESTSCCFGKKPSCSAFGCPPGVQSNDCDGPEDCEPGQHCLLVFGATSWGARCVAGPLPDTGTVLCHTPEECGPAELCVELETQGGLHGCYSP